MSRAAAIFDVPTTGGTVRVYIPAPQSDRTPRGPGLVKPIPQVVDTVGETLADVVELEPARQRRAS
jgi:hypothetical protein